MTQRVYNFSAGPAAMPVPILESIQRDMLALPGVGASILEISHRSGTFVAIAEAAEANLRKLLSISDDYAVLFLQGGSRLQFSMIPMNLLGEGQSADYILTGRIIRLEKIEGTAPKGVLELELGVRRADGKLIFLDVYKMEIAADNNSVEAAVRALNKALDATYAKFAADLARK